MAAIETLMVLKTWYLCIKLIFSRVAFTEANMDLCASEFMSPGSPYSNQTETNSFKV